MVKNAGSQGHIKWHVHDFAQRLWSGIKKKDGYDGNCAIAKNITTWFSFVETEELSLSFSVYQLC